MKGISYCLYYFKNLIENQKIKKQTIKIRYHVISNPFLFFNQKWYKEILRCKNRIYKRVNKFKILKDIGKNKQMKIT